MDKGSEAVEEQANSPPHERPFKPEVVRGCGEIDDHKQKVDSNVDSKVNVKSY
jgi:hypothetical protein